MKSKNIGRYIAFTVFGFILLACGGLMLILYQNADGIMRSLPYIAGGIGSGVFGGNLGTVFQMRKLQKGDPAVKRVEIAQKDERNRAIRDKAKAKAFDMMIYVFAALMLAFALVQADLYVVLALVAAYVFVIAANVYYFYKFNKEM